MSLFADLTSIPSSVVAGKAETWTETLTDYPEPDYSVTYVFSATSTPVDGPQRFIIDGEGGGNEWTFTFDEARKPGRYFWQKLITETDTERTREAATGSLVIQPNLAIAQTETFAQAQVNLLKTNLATLSASSNVSVSFNGQSFTRGDTAKLQGLLAHWQSIVNAEQRALMGLLDQYSPAPSRILTRLDRYSCSYGIPW